MVRTRNVATELIHQRILFSSEFFNCSVSINLFASIPQRFRDPNRQSIPWKEQKLFRTDLSPNLFWTFTTFPPGYCKRLSSYGWEDLAGGGVLAVTIQSEVRLTYFDNPLKKKCLLRSIRWVLDDRASSGEDSDSDIYMGDDYMYTYTLSFSLSFSRSPCFSLTHLHSLVLSLFAHTEIHTIIFWKEGWVLRGMSRSVECEFLDIFQSKTLFLLVFGKLYIYSITHPLTQSKVCPPSKKCHIKPRFWGSDIK